MFRISLPTKPRRPTDSLRMLGFLLCASVLSQAAEARNANYRLCFPSTTWFGASAPTLDGNIATDAGWRGAFTYIADNATNGTPRSNVIVQGIRDASNIYLSVEAHKTQPFENSDSILLAFDPTGSDADMSLLAIRPVQQGGAVVSNTAPFNIKTWHGRSGGAWQNAVDSPPDWVGRAKVSTTVSNGDFGYALELRIPLAGPGSLQLPANGDFGLYVDVLRVFALGGSAAVAEASWPPPPDAPEISGIETNTPDPNLWGGSTLAGSPCKGVHISNADIRVNGNTTQLNFPPGSNTFQVNVHNNSLAGGAQPIPLVAKNVRATFLIANFGFPTQWTQISTGNNPISADIPAPSAGGTVDGTIALSPNAWTVSAADLPTYQANPHQCVMVRLDANPSSPDKVTIVNNTAVQNMDFPSVAPKKMFRGAVAEIPTAKFAKIQNRDGQLVDLHVAAREIFAAPRREMIVEGAARGQKALLWTVNGYHHTGRHLKLNSKNYEIVSELGAYGYGVRYEGEAEPKWRFQFFGERGNNVEGKGDHGVYWMNIPQGENGYVNVAFEGDDEAPAGGPVEPPAGSSQQGWPRWLWWLLALFLLLLGLIVFMRSLAKHP